MLEQLRSGMGLSSSETHVWSEQIRVAEEDLRRYESEIACLKSRIAALTTEAGILKNSVGMARSMLSPVRRLPNEVLGRIFSRCHGLPVFSMSEIFENPPFLSVCIKWRNVALSDPSIWSSLMVEMPQKNGAFHPARNLRALKFHLSCSKASPLDVSIFFPESTRAPVDPVDSYEMVDSLALHAARFTSLSIFGAFIAPPNFRIFERLEAIQSFPQLKSLDLSCAPIPDSPRIWSNLLEKSSNLHSFGIILFFPTTSLTRLTSVSNLNITTLNDMEVFKIAQFCPNAITVTYSLWHDPEHKADFVSLPDIITPQIFPYAQELSIKLWGDTEQSEYDLFLELVPALTLPSLKSFSLSNMESSDGKFPLEQFSTFLSRSKCVLTSLAFESVVISDLDMVFLLQLLPNLTDLAIKETCAPVPDSTPLVTKHFLQSLHSYAFSLFDERSKLLVPKLQHLTLKARRETFDGTAFVEMVLSRSLPNETWGVESLQSAKVHVVKGEIDKEIRQLLETVKTKVTWVDESEED
ncbi:hypothetical protein VKT23_000115 [Stygiomarasmius scandens]|uniref:F-box domain-containing protein n=1 Tax=Marasmiellus scandens TaxID=2682957 RepID=A0ABR1K8N9_9AGAR